MFLEEMVGSPVISSDTFLGLAMELKLDWMQNVL